MTKNILVEHIFYFEFLLLKGAFVMKFAEKFLSVLIAVVAILHFASSVEAAKKTVMAVPLKNISGYRSMNIAEIMTNELVMALQNSGKYSVVEREQMSTILREQGFQNIAANPSTAVEMGNLSGANYSIIGQVTFVQVEKNLISKLLPKSAKHGVVNGWKSKVSVDIRFVNNETGEVVFAKEITGTKTGINEDDALKSACKEVGENFLKELMANSVGRVIDIQSGTIYIDQGTEGGFRKGDVLSVVRETSPLIANGKIIGMKTVSIGKIKIVEVNAEYSICKIISGAAIKKGDVVKRS